VRALHATKSIEIEDSYTVFARNNACLLLKAFLNIRQGEDNGIMGEATALQGTGISVNRNKPS